MRRLGFLPRGITRCRLIRYREGVCAKKWLSAGGRFDSLQSRQPDYLRQRSNGFLSETILSGFQKTEFS